MTTMTYRAPNRQLPSLSELKNNLKYALTDVFGTMLGRFPEIADKIELVTGLSAIVGFGGNISGFLALHSIPENACDIAGTMLGMRFAAVDDIVCDAMGEVVNMLAGSLKKYSSANGELFKISIPTIVWGSSYSTRAPKNAQQILIGVKSSASLFTVQLVVNTNP
jgi:chemotaxis protein CheX